MIKHFSSNHIFGLSMSPFVRINYTYSRAKTVSTSVQTDHCYKKPDVRILDNLKQNVDN